MSGRSHDDAQGIRGHASAPAAAVTVREAVEAFERSQARGGEAGAAYRRRARLAAATELPLAPSRNGALTAAMPELTPSLGRIWGALLWAAAAAEAEAEAEAGNGGSGAGQQAQRSSLAAAGEEITSRVAFGRAVALLDLRLRECPLLGETSCSTEG